RRAPGGPAAAAPPARACHRPRLRGAEGARPGGARGVRRWLLSGALVAGAIAAWQGIASLPGVDDLTLASPVETARALGNDSSLLFSNAWTTLEEVLLGLAAAFALGLGAAVLMHLFRPLRDAAYPLLIPSQAIPIPGA